MATYTGSNLTDVQSARTAENLSVREASLRRALAAIQAMSEVGRQSSAERIAGRSAANEAVRLQNMLDLGREQYGSQERVAGLERASRKEISDAEIGVRKLPFSEEMLKHELEKARLGIRPDPYMTRDIGQANIESIAMNDLAKSIAESANLTIDREEAELLKDLPGPDWWNKEAKIKDGLTRIITGLDAKLGENRQLLEFVPSTNRYKPRVRAIIPIPTGQFGPTPGASVVPTALNQSLLTPPLNIPTAPPIPAQPTGSMAVPIAPRTVSAWDAPGAYPVQQSYGRIALQEPMAVPQFRPPPSLGQAQQLQQIGQLLAAQQFQRMAALRAQRLREAQAAAAASNAVPETVLPYLTQ